MKTRVAIALALGLGLSLASCAPRTVPPAAAHLESLAPSLDALRDRFNAHADEIRLVALLSPT